jgi:hypothetical protein
MELGFKNGQKLGPDGIRAEISEIPLNDFEIPRKFRAQLLHRGMQTVNHRMSDYNN